MKAAEFFSKTYLFDPTPTTESRLTLPLIVLFGVLLLLAIVSRFVKGRWRNVSNRYYVAFLTIGIMGFLYIFARIEGLPWLGSRFAIFLVGLSFAIWITINSIWLIRFVPKRVKEESIESKYEKYLPKPKKGNRKK
jgi:hypothetical protein